MSATEPHHTLLHDADILRIVDPATDATTPSKARDEIQWPALDKLTPGTLKRTVSTLMKEWERSLTPPSELNEDAASKSSVSDGSAKNSDKECAISQMHHF